MRVKSAFLSFVIRVIPSLWRHPISASSLRRTRNDLFLSSVFVAVNFVWSNSLLFSIHREPVCRWICGARRSSPGNSHLARRCSIFLLWATQRMCFPSEEEFRSSSPSLEMVYHPLGSWSIEGPLVKHGFARTSMWTADPVTEENGATVCRFHLRDSEKTRAIWDYAFELVYTVRLDASSLFTELQ